MRTIIIVEDDLLQQRSLEHSLHDFGYSTFTCSTIAEAHKIIDNKIIDLAIIDYILPGDNGLTLLENKYLSDKRIKSILMTGYTEEENILRAFKLGIDDVIKKPYHEQELLKSIEKLLASKDLEEENEALRNALEDENISLKKQLKKKSEETLDNVIIGTSRPLLKTLSKAKRLAKHNVNILISGETGTGKELLARYIHRVSNRSNAPFVAINCAELSPSVIESELFGHQKGSYTGAADLRIGLMEAANGGVLFLDEITEIPLALQSKLLRVVEQKTIRRIGSNKDIELDIMILSATNRDCKEAVEEQKLRIDLFHRLASAELHLPPLRERIDDIDLLIDFFLKKFQQQYLLSASPLPDNLIGYIKNYTWPGNVRQLSNFIRNWCLIGDEESPQEAIDWLSNEVINQPINGELSYHFHHGTFEEIEQAKKWLTKKILEKYDGNKTKTAKHLGISYPGLFNLLKKAE